MVEIELLLHYTIIQCIKRMCGFIEYGIYIHIYNVTTFNDSLFLLFSIIFFIFSFFSTDNSEDQASIDRVHIFYHFRAFIYIYCMRD